MLCFKSNIIVPVSLFWYIISVIIVKCLIDAKNIVTHVKFINKMYCLLKHFLEFNQQNRFFLL